MVELKSYIIDELQTLSAQQLQELLMFLAFLKYKTSFANTNETENIEKENSNISILQQQLLLEREQEMKENPEKIMSWAILKHKLDEKYGE
jgi:hypothetical protein